jgi:sarcosine oxidase
LTYDVIVAGLGGMGSAATYRLARRGERVLGLERHTPAHDRGSSHGRSRIIRQAYFEGPEYVPLLLRAYELWEELERETGSELMSLTGGLMIGRSEGELVSGSAASADEHGLPYEMLEGEEIRRRFPALSPSPGTVALFERRAGFLRPEESVRAHLDLAAAAGADLHFEEPLLSWGVSGGGVRVETPDGSYEAGRLVISPGAWAPRLLSDLGLPLEVTRQVMYWFEPTGSIELFSPERFPIFIWEPDDGNMFYGFPVQSTESSVKTAMFRADGVPTDPETIDRDVRETEADVLRGYLAGCIPDLAAGRCLDAKACMYTNTPDEHFVISVHPENPQVVVACGFSGHGYKFCSVVGEILADLAIDGSTSYPIDLFSPTRLTDAARS